MKATGLFTTVIAIVLLFTTVSAAFKWVPDSESGPALARRQDNNDETTSSSDESTSATDEPSRTATDDSSESASATDDESRTSETASRTGGDDDEPSGNRTTTDRASRTNVDPRDPAGGVQLMTPGPLEGSQYYKVGDYITFQWNYTSLVNTPDRIDVYATCSLNSATYTIAANMSVEETGKVIWDTADTASVTAGFPVATYTLIIHDAARDPTQVASAGDLAAYNQFRFGMYTGQPYTPLNEFRCSTCSGALSLHERQALSVLGVTAAVTVLSFTWFANGFGLFA